MSDGIEEPGQPVDAPEMTLDKLSASVDRRFDAVDLAIVEQGQYTEFAFEKLERSMNARFEVVNAELAGVKTDLTGLKADVRVIGSGLGRVERKVDHLIDRLFPEPDPVFLSRAGGAP